MNALISVLIAFGVAQSSAPLRDTATPPLRVGATAPLRIGATAVPHAELLRAIAPELAKQGVTLDIRVYDDYGIPNTDVASGALDANFFQTEPYLWRWRAAHNAPLFVAGRLHLEPMGIYSASLRNLSQVKDSAVVAVPEDPANLGRALLLLQTAGLIRVDGRRGLDALPDDVVANPRHLKFRMVPGRLAAAQLSSAALAVVNGNYALQAQLGQPLFRESIDSPFPNVVVTREELLHDKRIEALVAALHGQAARHFLFDRYAGAVVYKE